MARPRSECSFHMASPDRVEHGGQGQECGDAEDHPSGHDVAGDEEGQPGYGHVDNARDIRLDDVVNEEALEVDGHAQTRVLQV